LTERDGAVRTKKAPTDKKSPRKKAARKEGTRKKSTRKKAARKTIRKAGVAAMAPVDGARDVTDVTAIEACEAVPSAAELFGEVRELITRYVFLGDNEANGVTPAGARHPISEMIARKVSHAKAAAIAGAGAGEVRALDGAT
jgi:hypothetical protein